MKKSELKRKKALKERILREAELQRVANRRARKKSERRENKKQHQSIVDEFMKDEMTQTYALINKINRMMDVLQRKSPHWKSKLWWNRSLEMEFENGTLVSRKKLETRMYAPKKTPSPEQTQIWQTDLSKKLMRESVSLI